jgi:signal peptidase II
MSVGDAIPAQNAFLAIRYTLNDGVAFSLFQGHRIPLIIIQSVLVVAILIVILALYRSVRLGKPRMAFASFSLMLGGGVGNLIDRVATGQVTDFISIGSFPIFNVADICLTTGCGLLLIYSIFYTGGDKTDKTGGDKDG